MILGVIVERDFTHYREWRRMWDPLGGAIIEPLMSKKKPPLKDGFKDHICDQSYVAGCYLSMGSFDSSPCMSAACDMRHVSEHVTGLLLGPGLKANPRMNMLITNR